MGTQLTDEQFDVFSMELKNNVIREFLLEIEDMEKSSKYRTASEMYKELERRLMKIFKDSHS